MIDVVNAEMVRALRVVSVEHGLDPRDFALVAFGGAGPAARVRARRGARHDDGARSCGGRRSLGARARRGRRAARRRALVRRAARRCGRAAARGRGRPSLRAASRSSSRCHCGPWPRRAFPRGARGALRLRRSRPRARARRSADRRGATWRRPSSSRGPSIVSRGPQALELDGATAVDPPGWVG